MLSQVFIANKMFVTNEVGDIEGSDKLIEKSGKLSKTGKVSKTKKLSKSQNWLNPKIRQKMEIHLNFMLKKPGRAFLPLMLRWFLTTYS